MEFVANAQGTYAMGGQPDVTPETAEEIFKKPLPIRSAGDKTGEFFHFEPGAEPGHWRQGHTVRAQAELMAKRLQRTMTPAMMEPQPRAPDCWPSSQKVRSIESVHMPEMAGWHRRSQGLPTGDGGGPPNSKSIWAPSVAPTYLKTANVRCEENAGFSWDPKARYGPETVKALPNNPHDNKVREALFDESADQKYDGVPDTGIHRFGSNALEPGYGSAALQKLRAGQL